MESALLLLKSFHPMISCHRKNVEDPYLEDATEQERRVRKNSYVM